MMAQAQDSEMTAGVSASKKSWEFGLGGNLLNISRMSLGSYRSSEKGDAYTLRLRNIMFGGNLYVARELTPWIYADLQATLGRVETITAE